MLAATHISISVLIVLLSPPVIDCMFGGSGPGSSPLLEHLSRGLIGLIGIWMIWLGMSAARHRHSHRDGASFGFIADLIPCPLTLFVMTYATARGVPALGLVFAALMLAGVAATLSAVAIAATAFRAAFDKAFNEQENCLARVSKVLEIAAGLVMVGVALNSIG